MTTWQNDNLTKWQLDKMTTWQIDNLMKWQLYEMTYHNYPSLLYRELGKLTQRLSNPQDNKFYNTNCIESSPPSLPPGLARILFLLRCQTRIGWDNICLLCHGENYGRVCFIKLSPVARSSCSPESLSSCSL